MSVLQKNLDELAAEFGKTSAAEIIAEIIMRLQALEALEALNHPGQPAQPEQPAEESHQRA